MVEIAKHNSISKAASALYVTQPSISKAMHELETELGIVILEGGNRIQLGLVNRNDVFLPEEIMVYIDFLTSAFETSKPENV